MWLTEAYPTATPAAGMPGTAKAAAIAAAYAFAKASILLYSHKRVGPFESHGKDGHASREHVTPPTARKGSLVVSNDDQSRHTD